MDIEYEINIVKSILYYLQSQKDKSNNVIRIEVSSNNLCDELKEQNEQKEQKEQSKNMNNVLIEDNEIFYRILGLYDQLSEKYHLKLNQNWFKSGIDDDLYETERSVESPFGVMNLPELMIPIKS